VGEWLITDIKRKTDKGLLMEYLKMFTICAPGEMYQHGKTMKDIIPVYLSRDEVKYIYKCLKECKKKL